MPRNLVLALAGLIGGGSLLLMPYPASARIVLTRAVVQSLRNRVRLIPRQQSPRPANLADIMHPGDALSTSSASMAELRFNDDSLARIGERAVFRFTPGTRNLRLSNGTVLLLIPPGRGRTNIRTPNAAAGIRGSALFVRHIPENNTTVVGALTNNVLGPMVVSNCDASQLQPIYAGQLAVVEECEITQLYDFDLNMFYKTSSLVKGLDLTNPSKAADPDDPIAQVRAEIVEALDDYETLTGEDLIENPEFVQLPAEQPNTLTLTPAPGETVNQFSGNFAIAPEQMPKLTEFEAQVKTPIELSPQTDSTLITTLDILPLEDLEALLDAPAIPASPIETVVTLPIESAPNPTPLTPTTPFLEAVSPIVT
ncbi:MAG: iron dicitrate transport regulator FecR, partial [Cyanothece sp. SIO1E1]|nr:iron dicitrate transport regulator FecR [Cyanothece sp. SIO1E1]